MRRVEILANIIDDFEDLLLNLILTKSTNFQIT